MVQESRGKMTFAVNGKFVGYERRREKDAYIDVMSSKLDNMRRVREEQIAASLRMKSTDEILRISVKNKLGPWIPTCPSAAGRTT